MSIIPSNESERSNLGISGWYECFPLRVKAQAEAAFDLFLENPAHPSLRHHVLVDTDRGKQPRNSRSVSINMQYRAIYYVVNDLNVWCGVGSHSEYDAFVGKK